MSRYANQKRWFVAGRRTLVLAGLTAMGSLAGCGASVSPEQKAAIAKIQDLGGSVNYKHGGYEVILTRTAIEDQDLAHLARIPNLKTLDLNTTHVGDEGIQHLRGIATLEHIDLRTTAVTREGLQDLKKALPKADITP